jgi:hypothetical protein
MRPMVAASKLVDFLHKLRVRRAHSVPLRFSDEQLTTE